MTDKMKAKLFAVVAALTVVAACVVPPQPPTTIPPAPVPQQAFDVATCYDTVVDDYCNGPQGVTFTLTPTNVQQSPRVELGDANGYAFVQLIPTTWKTIDLVITSPGYNDLTIKDLPIATLVAVNAAGHHNFFSLTATHFDPSSIPLRALADIRGAMWPTGDACTPALTLPFGPRPRQTTNIIATDFLSNYTSGDQGRIVDCFHQNGWTHAVMGPIVDSDGYHGTYTPTDWRGANWPKFLDNAQYLWDQKPYIAPVVYIHPDGWSLEQTIAELTPLLQDARAQKLIRIAVVTGWEPTRYGWSSCTWAKFFEWGHQVLPNALILAHTVADVDAMAGTDELCNDDDPIWNPTGNAGAWARVAPTIHGWLIQNGAYNKAPSAMADTASNFKAQFQYRGNGATQHSPAWHFATGVWAPNSLWGDGIPPLLYAAEQTSYPGFWESMPWAWRFPWGDLAVTDCVDGCAAGYLDGGTQPVTVH